MFRTLLTPAAMALLFSACAADPPNVLLITVDTIRADHVGCYGYSEPTTPNIDRLAEEGVVFTNAFATNPITLPSHASILSGTYPLHHGVRDNSTYVVDDEVTTLAEMLKERGYRTAAFVGAFVLDSIFNLDQGFDHYDDDVGRDWAKDEIERRVENAFGFDERKANLVTHSAQGWLKTRPAGPFFLWAHYFDPHQPLNPPDPHRSRFTDAYDAEIAFVDEQIGELLRSLREDSSYDNTVIVVVADHGEGLMDHGEPTHSLFIFDSTMHVPLIIKAASSSSSSSSVVDGLASTVDVVPTILELVGGDVPAFLQGRSLAPSMAGAPIPEDRSVYMESLVPRLACGWGELRGIRSLTEKLIFGPKPRLYRVSQDPGEVYDVADSDVGGVQRMTGVLEEVIACWRSPDSSKAVAGAPPETLGRLRALGYVTGSPAQAASVTEDLEDVSGMVDPHEKRHLFDLFSTATEDIRLGDTLVGIAKLERIVASEPGFKEAVKALATAYYLHAGRPEEARRLFERALAIDPFQDDAVYFLGLILLTSGDLEGARDQFEKILDFGSATAPALYQLGRIDARLGDAESSRSHYELALEGDPNHLGALIALGAWHARRKAHEEAAGYFRRARTLAPDDPEVLYNIGIWYLQEDDVEAAIHHLERTVEVNPADEDAHFVLGTLYAERGEVEKARRALNQARPLASTPERRAVIDQRLAGIAH